MPLPLVVGAAVLATSAVAAVVASKTGEGIEDFGTGVNQASIGITRLILVGGVIAGTLFLIRKLE